MVSHLQNNYDCFVIHYLQLTNQTNTEASKQAVYGNGDLHGIFVVSLDTMLCGLSRTEK